MLYPDRTCLEGRSSWQKAIPVSTSVPWYLKLSLLEVLDLILLHGRSIQWSERPGTTSTRGTKSEQFVKSKSNVFAFLIASLTSYCKPFFAVKTRIMILVSVCLWSSPSLGNWGLDRCSEESNLCWFHGCRTEVKEKSWNDCPEESTLCRSKIALAIVMPHITQYHSILSASCSY